MDLHLSNSDYSQSGLSHKEGPLALSSVFRDYDIRGLANSEITNEFALSLGVALGELALSQGHQMFFVGRDVRLSSPSLTEALCFGLKAAGCHVVNLGEVTTPIVNFAIEHDPIRKSGVGYRSNSINCASHILFNSNVPTIATIKKRGPI